jgi:hypothetical protein
MILFVLLFVVIGSVVLQIVQNTRNAAEMGIHVNIFILIFRLKEKDNFKFILK